MMETYYQVHYERMIDPSSAWDEIAEAKAQIRSDKQLMIRLQVEVDEQNRLLAEQEAQLEE